VSGSGACSRFFDADVVCIEKSIRHMGCKKDENRISFYVSTTLSMPKEKCIEESASGSGAKNLVEPNQEGNHRV
jgi:hypothetical protein